MIALLVLIAVQAASPSSASAPSLGVVIGSDPRRLNRPGFDESDRAAAANTAGKPAPHHLGELTHSTSDSVATGHSQGQSSSFDELEPAEAIQSNLDTGQQAPEERERSSRSDGRGDGANRRPPR